MSSNFNTHELAWAADFIDGEGNIRFNTYRRTTDDRIYGTAQLSATQTHTAVLERLKQALGSSGRIYGPYKPKTPNSKPYWTFLTKGFEDTQAAIAKLWPWLGEVKKEQAKATIKAAVAQSKTLTHPHIAIAKRLAKERKRRAV